jgi:hypothetical protein
MRRRPIRLGSKKDMLSAGTTRYVWLVAAIVAVSTPIHAAHLNAPTWDVWVVDQAGQPLSGVSVTEDYQDYSCESESHVETLITDVQGHVQFQPKQLSRNPVRCLKESASAAAAGVHASFGRHATVSASAKGLRGYAVDKHDYIIDWTGSPKHMTSRIVMMPFPSPASDKVRSNTSTP